MYTVGKLGKTFGLSRSTLLYYHSIKLLSPSSRSSSGYRYYSEEDVRRLERICHLRTTGLSLVEIKSVLASEESVLKNLLEIRLQRLNADIARLREQQSVILKILRNSNLFGKSRVMSKAIWVKILRSAGLDEGGMKKWHQEFENLSPEGHQDFLESLRLSKKEISEIRRWSRN